MSEFRNVPTSEMLWLSDNARSQNLTFLPLPFHVRLNTSHKSSKASLGIKLAPVSELFEDPAHIKPFPLTEPHRKSTTTGSSYSPLAQLVMDQQHEERHARSNDRKPATKHPILPDSLTCTGGDLAQPTRAPSVQRDQSGPTTFGLVLGGHYDRPASSESGKLLRYPAHVNGLTLLGLDSIRRTPADSTELLLPKDDSQPPV